MGLEMDALPHLDALELRLLKFQFNAFRRGGGYAGYIVTYKEGSGWIVGSCLSFHDLGLPKLTLPKITDDYRDWTELALEWRVLFEDFEGVLQLSKGGVAVTPRMLVEQWLRWKAWMVAGDHGAQVGKGRPAKINREEALGLRAEGMPVPKSQKDSRRRIPSH